MGKWSVTFEIENIIKAMELVPEREKEDPVSLGINNRFIYDYITRTSSWSCESEFLPRCEIPLLGEKLNPAYFKDNLAELKNVVQHGFKKMKKYHNSE